MADLQERETSQLTACINTRPLDEEGFPIPMSDAEHIDAILREPDLPLLQPWEAAHIALSPRAATTGEFPVADFARQETPGSYLVRYQDPEDPYVVDHNITTPHPNTVNVLAAAFRAGVHLRHPETAAHTPIIDPDGKENRRLQMMRYDSMRAPYDRTAHKALRAAQFVRYLQIVHFDSQAQG